MNKFNNHKESRLSLLIIVVLYKCNINESSTIQSILNISSLKKSNSNIVIWDNSPIRQKEKEFDKLEAKYPKFEYLHTGINTSLAKVYNTIIEKYSSLYEYVNIWDQDSVFDMNYYEKFQKAILDHREASVILPKVYNKQILESPGRFSLFKGKRLQEIEDEGFLSVRTPVAVMSGILIKKRTFSIIQFNEKLRLYGIDTCFFIDLWRNKLKIYVIDYNLRHDLSEYAEEDDNIKLFRFNDFCYSSLIISRSLSLYSYFGCILFLFYKSVLKAYQYKNINFIGCALRNLFMRSKTNIL